MDAFEMKTLNDGSRLVEKFADFAGSVILQLMQKQGYVDEQGIKALLNHIKKGGGTLTVTLSEERAEDFKELLKEAHIPFVEIEHVDATTKERSIFFVYRDCDQAGMKEVLKKFELALDKSCHEVDLETFEAITDKKNFGSVEGLTKEEVYAFREAAKDYNIHYCVVGNKDNYRILGTDAKVLEDIVSDMYYNLSGKLGHDYAGRLSNYFRQQEDFAERLRPEPGKVKYIVNSKNPSVFISVDEQGITTHSVGTRQERDADGSIKTVIYDCHHVTYPGFDIDKLKQLAIELRNPIILSSEDFPMVLGLSKTKEAILSQDFIKEFKVFVEQMKNRKADISKVPHRSPLYEKDNLVGLSKLPVNVIQAVAELNNPQIFVDGTDVAYPKELKPQMEALLEEHLYKNLTEEEKAEVRAVVEGREDSKDENKAIAYMLGIEHSERSVLRNSKEISPSLLNETQREALERREKRPVTEQTMNKEMAKLLRNQNIDRKMAMDVDR